VCIIEACEDRDLSGAARKRALVVTVLLAGLWADELLRVDVGDAVRFTAIGVDKQRGPRGAGARAMAHHHQDHVTCALLRGPLLTGKRYDWAGWPASRR
jgi:hypothetical protein